MIYEVKSLKFSLFIIFLWCSDSPSSFVSGVCSWNVLFFSSLPMGNKGLSRTYSHHVGVWRLDESKSDLIVTVRRFQVYSCWVGALFETTDMQYQTSYSWISMGKEIMSEYFDHFVMLVMDTLYHVLFHPPYLVLRSISPFLARASGLLVWVLICAEGRGLCFGLLLLICDS